MTAGLLRGRLARNDEPDRLQVLARCGFSCRARQVGGAGVAKSKAVDSLDTIALAPADALVLGRYRPIERLGAGGFGTVWSAYDEQLQRDVALKRVWLHADGAFPPEGSADRTAVRAGSRSPSSGLAVTAAHAAAERAEREAMAAARLSHPAIVALYEARAEGEAFYLISELVRGRTLGALLADEQLDDVEVLAVGVALAGALEHAHARGVIHRDVKPQNILVPDDPVERAIAVAKLTDFGGARLAGEDVLTRTGDVLGTLEYMAPEQCAGREADTPADLYSLALVLYEALSGVNPVRGANPAATARRIGGVLPPLERYRRDLPRELSAALDRALAPAPNARGTLAELREALQDPPERGRAGRRLRPRAPVESSPIPARRPHSTRPAVPREEQFLAQSFQADPLEDQGQQPKSKKSISIPRAVWMAATVAAVVWQSVLGRPGVALLALAAAAPLLLARRTPLAALTAALAPALGAVGLAGAFPAVAGQAAGWRARAGVAALGWWWLCLAEPLLGRRLWLAPPAGTSAAAGWERSLTGAAEHALGPLLSSGVLLGGALWAAAALVLPWLVRGRSAALDVVAASVWTAALVVAEPLLDHGLPLAAAAPQPRGALLAGVLGGVLAVAARAARGTV
jgi:serine/threonine protein kinase